MPLAGLEAELVRTVERVSPSVVRVASGPSGSGDGLSASGSGLLVGDGTHVVTNDHVVRGRGRCRVSFADGREVPARLVGEDPPTDLALLEVPRHRFPAAAWGDSSQLRVGQLAIALGNSLGLPGDVTVSVGVVSALGRPLPGTEFLTEGLVQTDAAINPGNSGGPLVTSSGEVVGITTAVAAFAQGVGFAIPSRTAQAFVEQMAQNGRVSRPWLGVQAVSVPQGLSADGVPTASGVYLAQVTRGGPAGRAGLRGGDTVVGVGGETVDGLRGLLAALARIPLGGAVDVEFVRHGAALRTVLRVVDAAEAR